MRVFFYRGSIAIVIAMLCISLYEMISMQNTYMHEEDVHKQTRVYSPPDGPSETAGGDRAGTDTTFAPAEANAKKYAEDSPAAAGIPAMANSSIVDAQRDMNPDIAAWLRLPNTEIDYPVVRGADNTFYLDHDVMKKKAASGSLFIDSGNSGGFTDFNTVIYGHNMNNGSMFGQLGKFADPAFFDGNAAGRLFLPDCTYALEIFACMGVNHDDAFIYGHNMKNGSMFGQLDNFADPAFFDVNTAGRLFLPDCTYAIEIFACLSVNHDDAFIYGSAHGADINEFNRYVKANALQYRDIHISGGDRVVTLSTCTNVYEDARIVVLARLVRLG